MAFKGLLGGGEAKGDGEAAETAETAEAGNEPAAGKMMMKSWRELREKHPECFKDVKVCCQWPAGGTILQKSFRAP